MDLSVFLNSPQQCIEFVKTWRVHQYELLHAKVMLSTMEPRDPVLQIRGLGAENALQLEYRSLKDCTVLYTDW